MLEQFERLREQFREEAVQRGLEYCTTDELITLQWCVSLMYEKLDSKEGTENLTLWKNRLTIALNSKK